mmetsp:Transcript_18297/g.36814  ORF Transcript_18297/g.36814 Transcript_18297/m.36814 type:complete len:234 (+) Transcript_18297:186-887(+)
MPMAMMRKSTHFRRMSSTMWSWSSRRGRHSRRRQHRRRPRKTEAAWMQTGALLRRKCLWSPRHRRHRRRRRRKARAMMPPHLPLAQRAPPRSRHWLRRSGPATSGRSSECFEAARTPTSATAPWARLYFSRPRGAAGATWLQSSSSGRATPRSATPRGARRTMSPPPPPRGSEILSSCPAAVASCQRLLPPSHRRRLSRRFCVLQPAEKWPLANSVRPLPSSRSALVGSWPAC